MKDAARARRLLVHITLRLVAATVLLGSALVVELRAPGNFAINPFFVLIAAAYAVSLVFIGCLRFIDRLPWLTDVHFAIDVVMVSAAIALTGGIGSLFTSLYVLPIVAASSLQFRRGALQVAALSALLYAGLVLAQYAESTGYLDPLFGVTLLAELPNARVAQYTVALNVFGLFAVAFLSGSLAERVRHANVRLEQASEEIADLQFFNQYVIDNLTSGLATADDQNRLMTFNKSAVLITGRALAKVVSQPALDVLQVPSQCATTLDDDLRRSRSRRMEYQYRRDDSRMITLGLSVAQLPLPNGAQGYLYTFQDVTDLKRLEHDAQLQKRLAAVGEMAAGIAHEIRNPLASMSGSMQMLREELALNPDQAQLMDIVLRESDRLNDTIRSFLSYAKPQRFEVQKLDLRPVIQDTATLLRNSTEVGENHTVDITLPDEEVSVEADANHVRQIVWNLATNGLRAMPHGGALRLRASIDRSSGRDVAVLTVTDEGVGIPAEDLEGIFQPFRGSFGRGTGLGLAIVHRLVSDYGARIDVQSTIGQGTTFRVTFPPARHLAVAQGSRAS